MAKRNRRRRAATIQKRRHTPGAAPGSIVVPPDAVPATLWLVIYDVDTVEEHTLASIDEIATHRRDGRLLWLDVVGLGDARTFTRMGALFGLHPLALEDAVNTHQRPKMEDYGDRVFVVLRLPETLRGHLEFEQVSIFVGDGFVITVHERTSDHLESLRERIRKAGGRVRSESACYLAYAILDTVLDHFFPLVEAYGALLEQAETAVIESADGGAVAEIYGIRHDLHALHRIVWQTREAADRLSRLDLTPIRATTRVFFRDAADHAAQVADATLGLQELSASLMELHLAATSNRMNEVMKMLTLIATIFIPLSFIASLYGMNFDPDASPWNMPELAWRYGYPMALAIMLGTAGLLLLYFRRRGWWR